jgi:hypothetical protein
MNIDDYEHLATTLSAAIEAAMWSTDYTEQVVELLAVQEALESRAKDLPVPDPARLRLEILHVLKRADAYEDDARAKEFGALFVMLETMTEDDRGKFATLLVQLLRHAVKESIAKA